MNSETQPAQTSDTPVETDILKDVKDVKDQIVSELKESDGTHLDSASSLNKLTQVLDDKVEELKANADCKFLEDESTSVIGTLPEEISDEVKDLEVKILDTVVQTIKEKSEEVKKRKRKLVAKHANDLDGFDL
jgi:cell division protein ZapA (FtsZ GTPase activity inhibitor)